MIVTHSDKYAYCECVEAFASSARESNLLSVLAQEEENKSRRGGRVQGDGAVYCDVKNVSVHKSGEYRG